MISFKSTWCDKLSEGSNSQRMKFHIKNTVVKFFIDNALGLRYSCHLWKLLEDLGKRIYDFGKFKFDSLFFEFGRLSNYMALLNTELCTCVFPIA